MLQTQKRIIRMQAQSIALGQADTAASTGRRYTARQLKRSVLNMARPTAVRSIVIGAAAALALLALPAEAQWKWRDAAGHVQYSDLPPPNSTPEKDILARPSQRKATQATALPASAASTAAAASSTLVPRTVEPELEAKRKKAEADQAAKLKADEDKIAAARADNCTRAKGQLKTLESGVRLDRTNDKGEREILDDAARDAEMKRSRDAISADCK